MTPESRRVSDNAENRPPPIKGGGGLSCSTPESRRCRALQDPSRRACSSLTAGPGQSEGSASASYKAASAGNSLVQRAPRLVPHALGILPPSIKENRSKKQENESAGPQPTRPGPAAGTREDANDCPAALQPRCRALQPVGSAPPGCCGRTAAPQMGVCHAMIILHSYCMSLLPEGKYST